MDNKHLKGLARSALHVGGLQALRLYEQLRREGRKPAISTIVAALKECIRSRDLQTGKRIHAENMSAESVEDDPSKLHLPNTLLEMYVKCGSLADAHRVFDRMKFRSVVSWTTVILGHVQNGEGRKALELFSRMQDGGIAPDAQSYVAALKACKALSFKQGFNAELMETAKGIHSQLSAAGHESDPFVVTILTDLYTKSGYFDEAWKLFNKSSRRDVASWNTMINGCVENGKIEMALQLFSSMQEQGFKPNARTYVGVARAYSSFAVKEEGRLVDGGVVKVATLEKARALHVEVSKAGYELDLIVANAFLDLYARCGCMEEAGRIFGRMVETSVVTWSRMILGYAQNGQGELGLELYRRMGDRHLPLDASTYVAVLKACGSQLRYKEKGVVLKEVRAIHSRVAADGYEPDMYVASTLVDLYSKCGSMSEAAQMFERTVRRDVPLWNLMIFGYVQSERGERALKLFQRMQAEGYRPNARTYVGALGACAGLVEKNESKLGKTVWLNKGKAIHRQLAEEGYETERFVASCLVDMYARGGCMVEARKVFDKVLLSNSDIVWWNNIITGYSENGEGFEALNLYECMQEQGLVPNSRTYLAVIHACSSLSERNTEQSILVTGRSVHAQLLRVGDGEADGVFVASALVDMYSKAGSMVEAQQVFDVMKQQDVVSWTSLVHGYSHSDEGELALKLLRQMQEEGVRPNSRTHVAALKALQVDGMNEDESSKRKALLKVSELGVRTDDVFVANSLLDLYAKLGIAELSEQVFSCMSQRSLVSWNSMMTAYLQCGEGNLALNSFYRMQNEGFKPNDVTYITVLKACGSLAALETGRRIHDRLLTAGYGNSVTVTNSLVSFYGRCGSMSDAHQVFDSAMTRDLVTWSSLLGGYSYQGDGKQVLDLFEKMLNERLVPDSVCFLHVLNACSHAGLVDKGKEYFRVMWADYGVTPGVDHWTCMVDLLGRANQLEEAIAMIRDVKVKLSFMVLETILGACSRWKNGEVARAAFESMLEVEGGHYILVANSYVET